MYIKEWFIGTVKIVSFPVPPIIINDQSLTHVYHPYKDKDDLKVFLLLIKISVLILGLIAAHLRKMTTKLMRKRDHRPIVEWVPN